MPYVHKPPFYKGLPSTRTDTEWAKVKREIRKKVRSCSICYTEERAWRDRQLPYAKEYVRESDWFVVCASGQCVCPECHDGNYEMAKRAFERSSVSPIMEESDAD